MALVLMDVEVLEGAVLEDLLEVLMGSTMESTLESMLEVMMGIRFGSSLEAWLGCIRHSSVLIWIDDIALVAMRACSEVMLRAKLEALSWAMVLM